MSPLTILIIATGLILAVTATVLYLSGWQTPWSKPAQKVATARTGNVSTDVDHGVAKSTPRYVGEKWSVFAGTLIDQKTGKDTGVPVYSTMDQPTFVCGTSGGGKSTCFVIPHMITVPMCPLVAVMVKDELAVKAAPMRAHTGSVFVFNPSGVKLDKRIKGYEALWTPLTGCGNFATARKMADTIISASGTLGNEGNSGMWKNLASQLLSTSMFLVAQIPGGTMKNVLTVINKVGQQPLPAEQPVKEPEQPMQAKQVVHPQTGVITLEPVAMTKEEPAPVAIPATAPVLELSQLVGYEGVLHAIRLHASWHEFAMNRAQTGLANRFMDLDVKGQTYAVAYEAETAAAVNRTAEAYRSADENAAERRAALLSLGDRLSASDLTSLLPPTHLREILEKQAQALAAESQYEEWEAALQEFEGLADAAVANKETAANVNMTISAALAGVRSSRSLKNTAHDSPTLINVDDLILSTDTLFIIAPDSEMNQYAPILTAFVEQIINKAVAWCVNNGGSLPRKLQVMLDELTNICPLPDLANYTSTVRSRNIHLFLCVQDLAQLEKVFGSEDARSIVNNCANGRYLLPMCADPGTLSVFSTIMGETEETKRSWGKAKSKNYKPAGLMSDGHSDSTNENWSVERRRLVSEEWLASMPEGEVVGRAGERALHLKLRPWYGDPDMARMVEHGDLDAFQRYIQRDLSGKPLPTK